MGLYKRRKYKGPKTKVQSERKRMLHMGKQDEFSFQLGELLKDVPEEIRGQLKGRIYTIASKQGIREAKEYVYSKAEEGVISRHLAKRIVDLLYSYSRYR